MLRRLAQRCDTARGTHDERRGQARGLSGGAERAEVARDDGTEVRVGSGRRGTLVLPKFRRHFVRGDHVCVRQPAPELFGDRTLVRRVAVGMQETDRNGIGIDLRQRVEVQGLELARRAHAPAHAVRALERHERFRPGSARPVEVRTRLPAQVQ